MKKKEKMDYADFTGLYNLGDPLNAWLVLKRVRDYLILSKDEIEGIHVVCSVYVPGRRTVAEGANCTGLNRILSSTVLTFDEKDANKGVARNTSTEVLLVDHIGKSTRMKYDSALANLGSWLV